MNNKLKKKKNEKIKENIEKNEKKNKKETNKKEKNNNNNKSRINFEENNEIIIEYYTKWAEKIKIFGCDFVRNNKNIYKIVYEDKEYELTEYFNIKNIKNIVLIIKLKNI
jgi:hypothetical protein